MLAEDARAPGEARPSLGGPANVVCIIATITGRWSRTTPQVARTLLDPHAPVPAFAGLYSVSGVSQGVPVEPGVFHMTFARNGVFLHLAAPDGGVWWSAQDHPVGAGQGASMALEDALVLARSLGTQTSVPAALSAYDAARSDRLARMAKAAVGNRDSKTAGPLGCWARDLMMPLGIRFFYEKATAWLYTYDCGELPGVAPRD
ncbi:hypothetical protein [Streptomyces sp. SID9124]|uniref:hypothetical protein n=1 Tax=Streptomyces sp. SID9124 TaxID=2706108 RepID=UPI001EF2FE38|nr:hypothetical protein [Streptomyces sp. SID9124]